MLRDLEGRSYDEIAVILGIAIPIESALAGLPEVRRIRSASQLGVTQVTVEFEPDADYYRSRQLVVERLGQVTAQLPAGSEPPVLSSLTVRLNEIMLFNHMRPVRSVHASDGWTLEKINEVAVPAEQGLEVSARERRQAVARLGLEGVGDLVEALARADVAQLGAALPFQQLALAIGRELGLSKAELDLLGHAALFHDIGKLAVPDSVLLKPASLTSDEWSLMQRHAEEGARIIDRLGFLQDAAPAIRHHHERFDGAGYPDRLAGEEIPLGARIIHVADALDSMLTTRIYRAARPADEALEELRRGAGSQFCPRCVSALERLLHASAEDEQQTPGQLLATAS